jgi:hypothetical protein
LKIGSLHGVRQWLLDPGSIYKAISAQALDTSTQQRLVARAMELGKSWPELPVTRRRAVLTALINRIDVRVDQIDIRLWPPRLSALFDVADAPLESATDDEVQILSIPVRLRRTGRAIRMQIEGPDPFTVTIQMSAGSPDRTSHPAPARASAISCKAEPVNRHQRVCS